MSALKTLAFIFFLVNSVYPAQISKCANGLATYYTPNAYGACQLGDITRSVYTAAAAPDLFDNSRACGVCYEVIGEKGSKVVMIADLCPGCERKSAQGRIHLDLDERYFSSIDSKSKGRVQTSMRMVPCNVKGNVKFVVDESNDYYFNGHVINSKIGIQSLQVKLDNGSFMEMRRQNNIFQGSIKKSNSYTVKIVGFSGEEIICYKNKPHMVAGTYDCGKQFKTNKFFDIFSGKIVGKETKSSCCKKPSKIKDLNSCRV